MPAQWGLTDIHVNMKILDGQDSQGSFVLHLGFKIPRTQQDESQRLSRILTC